MQSTKPIRPTAALIVMIAVTVGFTMAASPVNAAVVYTEIFDQPNGNQGIGVSGWNWAYSASGTDGDETSAGASGASGANRKPANNGSAIFYFYQNTDTARPNPVLMYADNTTGDFTPYAYSDITSVQFELRNDRLDRNIRLALKVDNAWFVSATSYNNAVSNVTTSFNVDPFVSTTWLTLNFTLNSSLTIGGAAALPTSGTVQGVGFYDPAALAATSSISRFDNITVNADPIPPAIPAPAALPGGLAMLALAAMRKRR